MTSETSQLIYIIVGSSGVVSSWVGCTELGCLVRYGCGVTGDTVAGVPMTGSAETSSDTLFQEFPKWWVWGKESSTTSTLCTRSLLVRGSFASVGKGALMRNVTLFRGKKVVVERSTTHR